MIWPDLTLGTARITGTTSGTHNVRAVRDRLWAGLMLCTNRRPVIALAYVEALKVL
ncbi:hypothetical protein [Methanopyrus kandleri]|uniref:Uncharacterized protein n=2 Tax=Methanopyrus kandleri TaxID=2320 RepID=Q8TYV7_METKA|nr:hypothetical protein [Methanopyrus kandleri]AAM01401.1 Uncharacterized protein MK0184 [Methanopyrus kandleri AV19]HII70675.1 hypothetical protein [Methanopyrus kandleri]